MGKNLSKVIFGIQLLASLLIIGAVYIWAPVCAKLLTLNNGNMVHMKCFYTGQASVAWAIALLVAAIAAYFSKTDHRKIQWVIIVMGIMIILNTVDSFIGIGICKKSDMACHLTAVWLRVGSAMAIISAFIDILANTASNSLE